MLWATADVSAANVLYHHLKCYTCQGPCICGLVVDHRWLGPETFNWLPLKKQTGFQNTSFQQIHCEDLCMRTSAAVMATARTQCTCTWRPCCGHKISAGAHVVQHLEETCQCMSISLLKLCQRLTRGSTNGDPLQLNLQVAVR